MRRSAREATDDLSVGLFLASLSPTDEARAALRAATGQGRPPQVLVNRVLAQAFRVCTWGLPDGSEPSRSRIKQLLWSVFEHLEKLDEKIDGGSSLRLPGLAGGWLEPHRRGGAPGSCAGLRSSSIS